MLNSAITAVDLLVVCCSSVDGVLRKMVDQDEFAMSAFINELLVLVGLIKVGCGVGVGCVWGGCGMCVGWMWGGCGWV